MINKIGFVIATFIIALVIIFTGGIGYNSNQDFQIIQSMDGKMSIQSKGGYYGKFFDLKEFDVVTIYASEWNNFVEITDIYDTRTYISCREADEFIKTVMQAKAEYDELPPEIE
jgi:hypothetical protein